MRIYYFLFSVVCLWHLSSSFEINLERIEIKNETNIPGLYNIREMRIAKYNRSTFALNADADILFDLNDNCEVRPTSIRGKVPITWALSLLLFQLKAEIFHSPMGNNQYTKSIAGVKRSPFCEVWEKFYRKHFMKSFKDSSNLPQYKDDEPSCPLKKVGVF